MCRSGVGRDRVGKVPGQVLWVFPKHVHVAAMSPAQILQHFEMGPLPTGTAPSRR